MRNFASRSGIVAAASAIALSIICLFIPYGYPWPSLASGILACAAAVWAVKSSSRPNPSMSDVISGVEGEPAAAVSPKRAAVLTKAVL
jgi:hypothetical protein